MHIKCKDIGSSLAQGIVYQRERGVGCCKLQHSIKLKNTSHMPHVGLDLNVKTLIMPYLLIIKANKKLKEQKQSCYLAITWAFKCVTVTED